MARRTVSERIAAAGGAYAARFEGTPRTMRDGGIFSGEDDSRHPLKSGRRLAPTPLIDKYPLVIGANLSLAYLSNAYRLCTQGWRYFFVDALSELAEHDPFTRGVTSQRIRPVAGARVEVYAAKLPPGDKDTDLAEDIADEVRRQFDRIPRRAQMLSALAYGVMTGASGAETLWDKSEKQWEANSLHFIHSRRINYPRPDSWDAHIWDQGAVGPGFSGSPATAGAFGLRIASYPGQFILHEPRLSGEYPTRDGELRYVGFHIALKRMVVRCSAQDFERTIRPWILGLYNREAVKENKTVADADDILELERAVAALGNGALNATTLPNACDIKLLRAASEYSLKDFIAFLKEEISVSILGQSHTTAPGAHGNRSASETARKGTIEINRYDALCLADTLERDLVYWIVKLNFPGAEVRLLPRVVLNVDPDLDPETLIGIAKEATAMDLPVDGRDLAERVGLKLVDPTDKDAIRTRATGAKDGPNPSNPHEVLSGPTEEEDEAGEGADEDTEPEAEPAAEPEPADEAEAEPQEPTA